MTIETAGSRPPSTALKYETVFLDFHGTFTNLKARLATALNMAHKEVTGQRLPKGDFQALLDRPMGVSVQNAIRDHFGNRMDMNDGEIEQLVRGYLDSNGEIYVPKYRPVLKRLHETGANCVIVTNGTERSVRTVLEGWDLMNCVVDVYGRGPGGQLRNVHEKPHPDALDFVIDDLRKKGTIVDRAKSLMVGDYRDDIGAGSNVGLHTAFLVTGPNQRPEDYTGRPTYALLDSPSMQTFSAWLNRERVFLFRDLPRIVTGEIG